MAVSINSRLKSNEDEEKVFTSWQLSRRTPSDTPGSLPPLWGGPPGFGFGFWVLGLGFGVLGFGVGVWRLKFR